MKDVICGTATYAIGDEEHRRRLLDSENHDEWYLLRYLRSRHHTIHTVYCCDLFRDYVTTLFWPIHKHEVLTVESDLNLYLIGVLVSTLLRIEERSSLSASVVAVWHSFLFNLHLHNLILLAATMNSTYRALKKSTRWTVSSFATRTMTALKVSFRGTAWTRRLLGYRFGICQWLQNLADIEGHCVVMCAS